MGGHHRGRLLALSVCDGDPVGLGVGSAGPEADHPARYYEYDDHERRLGLLDLCANGDYDAGAGRGWKRECWHHQDYGCRDGAVEGAAAEGVQYHAAGLGDW